MTRAELSSADPLQLREEMRHFEKRYGVFPSLSRLEIQVDGQNRQALSPENFELLCGFLDRHGCEASLVGVDGYHLPLERLAVAGALVRSQEGGNAPIYILPEKVTYFAIYQ